MPLTAKLDRIEGASPEQERFMRLAFDRMREAVTDPRFLPAVANADYRETRWTPWHGQWRALTGEEIVGRIAGGVERGQSEDGVLDFAFALVDLPGPETGRQVLGSTALGCQPIHPSRWFVELCREAGDAVSLASHFMHEWMHVSGFYHWPDNKARGDAAYVVGRLVREVLEPRYGSEIDPAIIELLHDVETDCGCRGNPPSGVKVGQP